MAYGVKYRLEFSDVLTKGKKIEIWKDGYTGSVLPMVGQAEPVVIKWNANDDPYNSPIIGSLDISLTTVISGKNCPAKSVHVCKGTAKPDKNLPTNFFISSSVLYLGF